MLIIPIRRAEQTVETQIGAVWSGSTLFAILSVLLETFKENQADFVKCYVHYVQSPNIVGNYGIILHKKM